MDIITTSIVPSLLLDLALMLSRVALVLRRGRRSFFIVVLHAALPLGVTGTSTLPTATSATSSARSSALHPWGPGDLLRATTLGPRPTLRPEASSASWEPAAGPCSQSASTRQGGGPTLG